MSKFNFKKYGGINNSAQFNIVRNNILYTNNNLFNTSGLSNSKETFLSHIDMSGNSLIHVGNIYFQDGTSISSSKYLKPTLADILTNGNVANKSINMSGNNLNHVNSMYYSNSTSQSTPYTGYFPPMDKLYEYSTITIDVDGRIVDVSDNLYSITPSLEMVLLKDNDGQFLNMEIYDLSTNYFYVTDVSLSGQIIQNQSGGSNLLNSTNFYGDISQNSTHIINQISTKSNQLANTIFSGVCKYSPNLSSFDEDLNIPNKKYIDDISNGISPTIECSCATTNEININSPGSIIDSYNLSVNDRILVKNQSNSINNGIYNFNSSSSPLTRSSDCSGNIPDNQISYILNGYENKSKSFRQITPNAITGISNLSYSLFRPLNFSIGQGLELINNSTIQLKSEQDFLTNLRITYSDNPGLTLKSSNDPNKQILLSVDCTTNTSKSNLISTGDNTIISVNSPLVLATLNSTPYSSIKIKSNEIIMNFNNKSSHLIDANGNVISTPTFKIFNSNNNSLLQEYSGTEQIFYGDTYINNNIYLNGRTSLTSFKLSPNSVGYTVFNTKDISWYNAFGSGSYVDIGEKTVFSISDIIPEENKLYLFIFNVDFRYYTGSGSNDESLIYCTISFYNGNNNEIDNVKFGGIQMSKISYTSVLDGNSYIPYTTLTYTRCFKGSDIQSTSDKIIYYKGGTPFLASNNNSVWQMQLRANTCSLTVIS